MKSPSNSSSTSVRWIGFLIVLAMVAYVSGTLIIMDVTSTEGFLSRIAQRPEIWSLSGALYLINSLAVLGVGIIAYPLMKAKSPTGARIYYSTRVFEAVVLTIGIAGLLSIAKIAAAASTMASGEESLYYDIANVALSLNWYAYYAAMTALGCGSIVFCQFLWRSKLVPRLIIVFGFLGYSVLAVSSLATLIGYQFNMAINLPVFIFEVGGGLWLLWRGTKGRELEMG